MSVLFHRHDGGGGGSSGCATTFTRRVKQGRGTGVAFCANILEGAVVNPLMCGLI